MTITAFTILKVNAPPQGAVRLAAAPGLARTLFVLIIGGAIAVGFLATSTEATLLAVSHDGASLTRLLRAMAAIKALLAIGAAAATLWRFGAAVSLPRFAAYAVAGAAMAAGPGLIWGMAHVGLGALLLHGGLLGLILLLWRDPGMAARLEAILVARRALLASRRSLSR